MLIINFLQPPTQQSCLLRLVAIIHFLTEIISVMKGLCRVSHRYIRHQSGLDHSTRSLDQHVGIIQEMKHDQPGCLCGSGLGAVNHW